MAQFMSEVKRKFEIQKQWKERTFHSRFELQQNIAQKVKHVFFALDNETSIKHGYFFSVHYSSDLFEKSMCSSDGWLS